MGHYKANATNSHNFSLTFDNQKVGELVYKKWYSFSAEIQLTDGLNYQLEPTGTYSGAYPPTNSGRIRSA